MNKALPILFLACIFASDDARAYIVINDGNGLPSNLNNLNDKEYIQTSGNPPGADSTSTGANQAASSGTGDQNAADLFKKITDVGKGIKPGSTVSPESLQNNFGGIFGSNNSSSSSSSSSSSYDY